MLKREDKELESFGFAECISQAFSPDEIKSDIRSMINFMQSNQDVIHYHEYSIIDENIWENILLKLKSREKPECLNRLIYDISIKYNIDKKNIIKDFLNYIIRNHNECVNSKFLNLVENIIHAPNQNSNISINYLITKLYKTI